MHSITTLERTPPDWLNRTRQRTRAARVAAGLCMICGGSMKGCKPKHIRCFKCRMARSIEYYANALPRQMKGGAQ